MKKWYQSRTIWAGILEVLIGALLLLEQFLAVGDFSESGFIILGAGIIQVLFRVITSEPVTR